MAAGSAQGGRGQGPQGRRPSKPRKGDAPAGAKGRAGEGRRPKPAEGRRGGDGSGKGAPRGKQPDRGGRRGTRDDRRAPREERTDVQRAYDGPELPDDITGRELDRSVAAQLQGLPEKLALRVARHLVAAGRLVDEDPALAYAHAKAARARASRSAVVREACGEAAYAAGEYAEALTELRAAKRMTGANDYLPMIADCERALGRPEKAIALARSAESKTLAEEIAVEMTIVEAGARRDLGDIEAALRTLEAAPLTSRSRQAWSVRLRYAYADTLEAAARSEEAAEWFHRTAAIDNEGITDAAERAQELDEEQNDGLGPQPQS